ncbi:NAD(P)-dependent oxidoreductase [Bacillus sp. Marseille-P3661]|uniref:NAD(P)-dependent oxidoreductase n=1 Tax=Bacillus sp. Marseille-P3661 TaxID=1936234 RepID=UPI000C82355C|nr:NAD(P)-dependent oxidoreductase [Bacillus sp. Marseille-P3661]
MDSNLVIKTCGVIGLGSMGKPMANHIKNNGYRVIGYDINQEMITAAAALGIKTTPSIVTIGEKSDLVLIMVQNDQQVREIILSENGLVNTLRKETIICIASSISPFTCKEIEIITKQKGIRLLDTPVCLGQEACNNGTLTVFVGGEEIDYERAKPVLESFATHVIHVGESGVGQIAKTANNLLLWASMTANFEILSLAKNLNVDISKLIEALMYSSGANWSLSRWGKSTGKWSEKDMDVALELAQQAQTPMPLCGLVDQLVKNINQEKMRQLFS